MSGATAFIYKLVPAASWQQAELLGRFVGSPADLADGYIHFSTAAQVADTAAKHFAGVTDLLLVEVATADVEATLRWEPSRGGALFPHIYGDLPLSAVRSVTPLPLGDDGHHVWPGRVA